MKPITRPSRLYFRGTLGINFSHKLQIAITEQPWYVRIQQGALDNLPFIGTRFPGASKDSMAAAS